MRTRLLILACVVGCSSTGTDTKPLDPKEAVAIQAGCPKPAVPTTAGVDTAYGILYSSPTGESQLLDVAWPATVRLHPLVVLVHGGSWSGGSRTSMRQDMLDLAHRGYTAATIDYRLAASPHDIYPAAIRDVRCAIRFLRSRTGDYAIDPARVAIAGFSAGGHLASLAAVVSPSTEVDGDCAVTGFGATVNAVISFSGPQDLRVNGPYTQEQADLATNFLGAFPGDSAALASRASPITSVDASDPPFLMIHGTADGLVPIDQARRMRAAIQDAGGRATLIEVSDLGHIYLGLGISQRDNIRCTSLAFLERWIGS